MQIDDERAHFRTYATEHGQPYSYSLHSNNVYSKAFDSQMAISTQWKMYTIVLHCSIVWTESVQYVLALLAIILLSSKSTEHNVCVLCNVVQPTVMLWVHMHLMTLQLFSILLLLWLFRFHLRLVDYLVDAVGMHYKIYVPHLMCWASAGCTFWAVQEVKTCVWKGQYDSS